MESDLEGQRLAEKVDPKEFFEKYIEACVEKNPFILDLGCGPAIIDREIARSLPGSRVVALDSSMTRMSDVQKNIVETPNVIPLCADIYDIPAKSDTFDFVFSRFLFEYLDRPINALSEMVRVCKPKGKIMIQDIDGNSLWNYPEDDVLQNMIENVLNNLKRQTGFDPFVGRKLYHYAFKQGLKRIETNVECHHLYAGAIDGQQEKEWAYKLNMLDRFIEDETGDMG